LSFATAADLTAFLAGDADQALALAQGLIVGYCGWSILEQTGVTYTVPAAVGIVNLPTLRLTALSAVDADGNPVELNWTEAGVVYGTSLASWLTNIPVGTALIAAGTVITYTHGYPADEIPADLKLATLQLAADMQSGAGGQVAAETILGYSVTYVPGSGPVSTTEILDRYRIVLP
jgi:hypothetical protein